MKTEKEVCKKTLMLPPDCPETLPPEVPDTPTPAASAEPPGTIAPGDPEPDAAAGSEPKPVVPEAEPPKRTRRLKQAEFPDPPRPTPYQTPATIENLRHLLKANGISIRYNVIKKKVEIVLPELVGTPENRDATALATIFSLAALNHISTGAVQAYVDAIGDMEAYNPVADWIRSRAWDGYDRMVALSATVTTGPDYPDGLKDVLLRKWLRSAVAAAILPSGFRTRGVLVLQGRQGLGKTTWFQSLVPEPSLRETYVKVDHHMDPANKDSVLGAVTHWMVEFGEIDSVFKKDVARLKGFLTSTHDKVRRPYGRVEVEYPRRTVFLATVNEHDYLVDTTGNSRWWTIACEHIDYKHGIDMQQLFAQLAVEVQAGEIWWLTEVEEAQLEAVNLLHQSPSVIEERLMVLFDMKMVGRPDLPHMTATEVLQAVGIDNPTNGQAKECAAILRRILGPSTKLKGYRGWRIPANVHPQTGQFTPVHGKPD